MMNNKTFVSISIVSILFSGCSITPQEIKPQELKKDILLTEEKFKNNDYILNKNITINDAVNLAIKHNLKRKIDLLTIALSDKQLSASNFEMLPELMASGAYSYRNRYSSSYSDNIDPSTNEPINAAAGTYSTSQERISKTSNVTFSWNVLDFGLSYIRAQQMADNYLIANEKARKSMHIIEQEVKYMYYQVLAGDKLIKQLTPLIDDVKDAYKTSNFLSKNKIDNPIHHFTYQRELLEIERTLHFIKKNLLESRTKLSQLMGLKPGTIFKLDDSEINNFELPKLNVSVKLLEQFALENRPELQEARYKERISKNEVNTAILKLLPGVNLSAGYNYDSNKYLQNDNWQMIGLNASWNLFNIFTYDTNKKVAELQEEIAKQEKVALAMAIISQVHISILQFEQAKEEFSINLRYLEVSKSIFDIAEKETLADVNDKLSFIKEKLNYLIANIRVASSYAEVQNAFSNINVSIGKNSFYKNKDLDKSSLSNENIVDREIINDKK